MPRHTKVQQTKQAASRLVLEAPLAKRLALLVIHRRPKALKHKHRLQLQLALQTSIPPN
jgi:hypothetical protein